MHADSICHERISRHAGRIETLIASLTLDEKCRLCHGISNFVSGDVARLGIAGLVMSDGPHGVREEQDGRGSAADNRVTYLPTGSALAATWSVEMAALHGSVLGAEARARGKDVILGPGFDLTRTPLCGRNFEYLGEDPVLAGALACAAVRAIQEHDVAACAKHFAVNDQELDRMAVDAVVEPRVLRELHLKAFERAVVDAGALTVMGAYNKLNGVHCCHHDWLLNAVLKRDWGFAGAVVSDWGGVHDTLEAALGGLDIEMGCSPQTAYLGQNLVAAVRQGRVPMAVVDDKVRRILRLHAALGLWDAGSRKQGALNAPEHRAAARRIADEALVLLKNDGCLPWNAGAVRRVLVVGDLANVRHSTGGGSSAVRAWEEPTPLEALRTFLGPDVKIEHLCAPDELEGFDRVPPDCLVPPDAAGIPGWSAEWFDNRAFMGAPAHTSVEPVIERTWEGIGAAGMSVRYQATLVAPETGRYEFKLDGTDCVMLWIDDQAVASLWGHPGTIAGTATVQWQAGERHRLKVYCNPKGGTAVCRLSWRTPSSPPVQIGATAAQAIGAAVAAARSADAVLVVDGVSHLGDSEGRDRGDYGAFLNQARLIAAVAEANPRTAVALVSGAPCALPWLDRVGAVILTGYAGMYMAPALVDLLFGRTDPRGRLPFVWPKRLEDVGCHALDEYRAGAVRYREGLLLGQRWHDAHGIAPEFPFGHGLTWTRFEYAEPAVAPGSGTVAAVVECTVANVGSRAGSEVIQVYVENPQAPDPHPVRTLAGFAKTHLMPGEKRRVSIPIDRRELAWWDESAQLMRVSPGDYRFRIGASAGDLRLEAVLSA